MTTFVELAATKPVIFVHAVSMIGAVALGGWLLVSRKGRTAHRVGGWAWVALMATAAISSLFIRSKFPGFGGFGPIHLLTLLVMVMLPLGVFMARSHRVEVHRQMMRRLYIGACLVAGAFTLLPGRILGQMLWA
ncbi:MAG: DUF2306 domain-containing protein [Ideonella sp. WA131b]|jgi:uncharacterized membrane protein|nr:DUF2306 domain-containing protein [Ideonella sp. WA131b]